ncbi:MAG TPA: Hsp20/alpha crystallin family protein [Burkholderiaceae bacterium]|nr:Hsp20/alpha crystallin family protein [Burkholderiaceae bacterium]
MSFRHPLSSFGPVSATDPFAFLNDEMDRLVDHAFRRLGAPAPQGDRTRARADAIAPRMDVTETDREIVIAVDVPGVAREDLELAIDGDVLTLRGRRRPAPSGDGDRQPVVRLSERAHGEFERRVRLPFEADPERCRAALRDGVLSVTLARPEAQRRARRLEIVSSQEASAAQASRLRHGEQEVLEPEAPAERRAAGEPVRVDPVSPRGEEEPSGSRMH